MTLERELFVVAVGVQNDLATVFGCKSSTSSTRQVGRSTMDVGRLSWSQPRYPDQPGQEDDREEDNLKVSLPIRS